MSVTTRRVNVGPSPASWTALLAIARKAMADGREISIPTYQARPMRGQPRTHFDPESLRRLGESMETIGQIYPGIVRSIPSEGAARYELLDGERRWRAAKERNLKYRALLVDVGDASASFVIAATANFNREGHTPTEVSDAIASMLKLNMPMREIASVLGLSYVWATQMLSLQKLVPVVRAMLDPTLPKDKRLPLTAAVEISKADESLQVGLARRTLKKEIGLQGLRGEVVRLGRASGLPVRERALEPRHQWSSLRARAAQLDTVTKDLQLRLGSVDDTRTVLVDRPGATVHTIVTQLRAAAARAVEIAVHLETCAGVKKFGGGGVVRKRRSDSEGRVA